MRYFVTVDVRGLRLSEAHTDICLSFGAEKGYFTSLNSFMLGCNIPGKNGSGADAITAWLNGSKAEKKSILDYYLNAVRHLRDPHNTMTLKHTRHTRTTTRALLPPLPTLTTTLHTVPAPTHTKPPSTTHHTITTQNPHDL